MLPFPSCSFVRPFLRSFVCTLVFRSSARSLIDSFFRWLVRSFGRSLIRPLYASLVFFFSPLSFFISFVSKCSSFPHSFVRLLISAVFFFPIFPSVVRPSVRSLPGTCTFSFLHSFVRSRVTSHFGKDENRTLGSAPWLTEASGTIDGTTGALRENDVAPDRRNASLSALPTLPSRASAVSSFLAASSRGQVPRSVISRDPMKERLSPRRDE